MKNLIAILLLSMVCLSNTTKKYSDFCDGFKEGWKDGYCYKEYGCVAPYPPVCPVRDYNEKDTYDAGFKRGFLAGIRAK